MEYAEAKRELKSKKIRFQTPFPAKLRVFYEDGVKVYQTATEATRDMVKRGLAVKVVHTSPTLLEEIERLFAWQVTKKRGRGKKVLACTEIGGTMSCLCPGVVPRGWFSLSPGMDLSSEALTTFA
ncbi:hypothetical protein NFI96_032531 [Prochilodus magdalenae]|nr:hypothetical protein NFI96_032531 [Prochilodus magdalenae]